MASLELLDILSENTHVTMLKLPDGSWWCRAKCITCLRPFSRCDRSNALYNSLPQQAYFKSKLGDLLDTAGIQLKDLPRPENCPRLLRSDVMLSAFGVIYLILKRGNTGRSPLTDGQQAVLRYLVPLLATQPAHCTLPPADTTPAPEAGAGALAQLQQIAPDSLWFDLETLLFHRLGLRWRTEKLVEYTQRYMPDHVKQTMQYDMLFPIAAVPFIKPWLHACLDAEAQEDYHAAGSPGLEGQK